MGTNESTALMPVCMGSLTEIRGIIPGAFTPTLALMETYTITPITSKTRPKKN
jgi:hypothetical protein